MYTDSKHLKETSTRNNKQRVRKEAFQSVSCYPYFTGDLLTDLFIGLTCYFNKKVPDIL